MENPQELCFHLTDARQVWSEFTCTATVFQNVTAWDAQNTDGIDKTRFTFQTNGKQIIFLFFFYHTKERAIETWGPTLSFISIAR